MSAIAPMAIQHLWADVHQAIPRAVLSGIVGDVNHSFGYHLARRDLGPDDYSVQLVRDRRGSSGNASALDVSLPPDLMTAVTQRLLHAAKDHDPRLRGLREFCGTLNGTQTFPWDLSSDSSEGVDSWDDSHLWHIHLSFYREFADDYDVLAPIADVMAGVDQRQQHHHGQEHHHHGQEHHAHGEHSGQATHAYNGPSAQDIVAELLKDENLHRLATAIMRHPIDSEGTTFRATVRQAQADAEAAALALNDPHRGVVVQLAKVKQLVMARDGSSLLVKHHEHRQNGHVHS